MIFYADGEERANWMRYNDWNTGYNGKRELTHQAQHWFTEHNKVPVTWSENLLNWNTYVQLWIITPYSKRHNYVCYILKRYTTDL
jgi:hypothetical protein